MIILAFLILIMSIFVNKKNTQSNNKRHLTAKNELIQDEIKNGQPKDSVKLKNSNINEKIVVPLDREENNIFKAYQQEAETLNLKQLQSEIQKIEISLNQFVGMNFDDFSPSQLMKFNEMNRKKIALLKSYIFKKYAKKINEVQI